MRPIYNRLCVAGVSAAMVLPTLSCVSEVSAELQERPNVIFILIDDVSYFGIPAYGAQSVSTKAGGDEFVKVNTPNIDKLAQEGVMCTHAYAHALSEATRVALMTGMNNGRNYLVPKSLHDSQITFGDVFQRAGYATGMYGKWKQTRGTTQIPGKEYISAFGWDDYACFDVITERQRYVNPELVVNGERVSYIGRDDIDPETGRRWYGPDIFNRKALEFIEEHQDEPFFLYYPMVLIHDEHRPTPDSEPKEVFDTMPEGNKDFNDLKYVTDMLTYADKMTGRIVDKLEELDLRDNTIIVVMGDNGGVGVTFTMEDGSLHVGGKGRTNYAGEQVPLIFSCPGLIPASSDGAIRRYDGLVDLTDIYPTLITSCGIEIPNEDKIDGVSLWSQIVGESIDPHRDVIYKWYNGNWTQREPTMIARYSHTDRYKYYAPSEFFPEGRFFDLELDPTETGGEMGPVAAKNNPKSSNRWYGGLEASVLNDEQRAAMEMLRAVNDENRYIKVQSIAISDGVKSVNVGDVIQLQHSVTPSNATRNGVIWESSDSSIASVNKFGELTAHKAGRVTISLYSWDDAWPVATGDTTGGYSRDGMRSNVVIEVL
ncbi:MAG: sulfatase-like hydrolase/transferase [Rikenellaceae bacterium]